MHDDDMDTLVRAINDDLSEARKVSLWAQLGFDTSLAHTRLAKSPLRYIDVEYDSDPAEFLTATFLKVTQCQTDFFFYSGIIEVDLGDLASAESAFNTMLESKLIEKRTEPASNLRQLKGGNTFFALWGTAEFKQEIRKQDCTRYFQDKRAIFYCITEDGKKLAQYLLARKAQQVSDDPDTAKQREAARKQTISSRKAIVEEEFTRRMYASLPIPMMAGD